MINSEISPYIPPSEREVYSECGMFAAFLPNPEVSVDLGSMIAQGLVSMQHRAEGATGMYLSNVVDQSFYRGLGTVAVATDEGRNIPRIPRAKLGMGHTRYPTSGRSKSKFNIQPLEKDGLILGHHGNLLNAQEVLHQLKDVPMGDEFPDSDSWIALNAISQAEGDTLAEKVVNAQRLFKGGWAFIVSDGKSLVAARDPYGIRPLFVGKMGSNDNPFGYLLSVESCAFRNFGVNNQFREVAPGQTIEITDAGIRKVAEEQKGEGYCAFEFMYMMRPDSFLANKSIYKTRARAGRLLWHEAPVELPEGKKLLVQPIPNSGRPGALGYYHEAQKVLGDRVVYDERILANQYMGRNFIKETQNRAAYLKFYPVVDSFFNEEIEDSFDDFWPYLLDESFMMVDPAHGEIIDADYEVVLIDDTIVRGDTSPDYMQLASMIRGISHDNTHIRIFSPEVVKPCGLGVAMPTFMELLANRIPDIRERAAHIGIKSLGHLSLDGLSKAIGIPPERLCMECFGGGGPYAHHEHNTIPLLESSAVLLDNS